MLASYLILELVALLLILNLQRLTSKSNDTDVQPYVTTPLETTYHIDLILRDYVVKVERRTLPFDLVQLKMQG